MGYRTRHPDSTALRYLDVPFAILQYVAVWPLLCN